MGRVGELREVGLLALYLVSDASSYMTGETIFLDGGALKTDRGDSVSRRCLGKPHPCVSNDVLSMSHQMAHVE